ncbi:MAG: AsmA family protein [Moraxellaceae bacterium]
MKRILLLSGLVLTGALGGTALLLAQRMAALESGWQSAMQAKGIQVKIGQPFSWQLFPPGLKAGDVLLQDSSGPLLRSKILKIQPGLADVMAGRAGELLLEQASLIYRSDADGHSNWDTLLQEKGSGLRRLSLHDSQLEIWSATAEKPLIAEIKKLQLKDMEKTDMPLTADFLISHQPSPQQNVLLESSLITTIHTGISKQLLLKNLKMNSTISSTQLPGVLQIKSGGDIAISSSTLHGKALQLDMSLKTPGAQDEKSIGLKADFQADLAHAKLSLPQISLQTGPYILQTQGPLEADWNSGVIQAKALAIRFSGADKKTRKLDIGELKLSGQPDKEKYAALFKGRVGEGRFELPLTATLSPDKIDITVTARLTQIDLVSLRSLLQDSIAQGTLELQGKLHLQGRSVQEIQSSAEGDMRLSLRNGVLGAINIMPALRSRLEDYASLLPNMQPADPAGKITALKTMQLEGSVKNGMFITSKATADMGPARLEAKGHYDSRKGLLDYDGSLHLHKELFVDGKSTLSLALQCRGNLQEEQLTFMEGLEADCKVNDDAKRDLLARALIQRFRSN